MIILRTELISNVLLVSTGCHIWILGFLSVRNPPIVLNSPLTKNHLTSICISRLGLFIPTATRKLLLKVSLFVTAGVVQPLNFVNAVRHKFWERLRLRGYPFKFLLPIFRSVTYADRSTLLKPFSIKVKQRS